MLLFLIKLTPTKQPSISPPIFLLAKQPTFYLYIPQQQDKKARYQPPFIIIIPVHQKTIIQHHNCIVSILNYHFIHFIESWTECQFSYSCFEFILVLLMEGQFSVNSAPVSKKQTLSTQTVFKYVNAILILILLYCIPGFLNFREYAQQKGWYVFSTDSLIWCAAGFFGIFIIKYSYYHLMKNTLSSILHEKYEGEDRVYKLNSILKLSLDTIFYSFTSIMAYVFFRNEEWFPSLVGGAGSCSNMYKSYPNWPQKSQYRLQIYYMIQLGVHIFSVFEMIVIKRGKERKYYEYLLHHSVAASLILFSMMCNQTPSGGMTLIVHDFSDIFLAFGRFFVQTKYSTPKILSSVYVVMTSIWIYMRIIVFPFCILSNVYINKPTPSDQWHIISFQYSYLLSMAIVLYGMHIFWTYFLIRIGLRSLAGKKMSNIHEENKNKEK